MTDPTPLRIIRLPVGRRASGFVPVAKWLSKKAPEGPKATAAFLDTYFIRLDPRDSFATGPSGRRNGISAPTPGARYKSLATDSRTLQQPFQTSRDAVHVQEGLGGGESRLTYI